MIGTLLTRLLIENTIVKSKHNMLCLSKKWQRWLLPEQQGLASAIEAMLCGIHGVGMEYEIDFLPVGECKKSGDAICLRYSSDYGSTWHVGVVDGGTQESGEALCSHIQRYYGTKTIDFLICTHPDQDHASGLSFVLENMEVKKVLMHCPWDYVDYIYESINDARVTKQSLQQRLIEGHPYAYKVYEAAQKLGIPIYHPFSDINDHGIPNLKVVGPSTDFYFHHVLNFRSITDITEDHLETGILEGFLEGIAKAVNWLFESWDEEHLTDPLEDATSSENNTSVIAFFDFDGKKILLTADAGVPALQSAADTIEEFGHSLGAFTFIQVPHHGSKRNVGPTVLDRLLGVPGIVGQESNVTAFVSASCNGEPKHPNKRVVNAFIRRGAKVVATQGSAKCHFTSGAPDRGWETAAPLPFYAQVEDDD